MANSRQITGWTPFNRRELAELRQQMRGASAKDLRERYEKVLALCGLCGGQHPPRPTVVQEFVQCWRELYRRMPKGRD